MTVIFIIIPAVNHVRMLLAIRRHNKQVAGAAVRQHFSAVLRREKKVAKEMAVIVFVLLMSLAPTPLNKIIENSFPKLYATLQPWAVTMVLFISTVNPLYYTLRNKDIKDGMKSLLPV